MRFTFLALLLPTCLYAENLFENSTMEPKVPGWKGHKEFVASQGNSIMVVPAKKNRKVIFQQDVDTRKRNKVTIRLKYRSKDYEGPGLTVRCVRESGSTTYADFPLQKSDKWEDLVWEFPEFEEVREICFMFEVNPGKGTVYFDDVRLDTRD